MNTDNTIELCEQIHELRTDATIMEAAMNSQQKIIEKRGEQITILTDALDNSQRLGNLVHEELYFYRKELGNYLLTRDISFNIGKAYIANLCGNTTSEAGFLMIATKDIDLLHRTSIDAADDYIELLKVGKQRIDDIIGERKSNIETRM